MPALTLDEINRLSIAERIQLAADIWDTIAAHPQDLPITTEQAEELDSRLADAAQHPAGGAPWHEVRQRITGKP